MQKSEESVSYDLELEATVEMAPRRPPVGLAIDLRTVGAGIVELPSSAEHRLSVHAGASVRAACHTHGFHYTRSRGDVDILPAGHPLAWESDTATAALVLRFSPLLLRAAAEELGLDPDRSGLEPRHQIRDPQIEHVAWALEAECRAGYPNGRVYTDSLGLALAVHLLGRYRASLEGRQGLSKPQLRRVTEYIEEHLDQSLSLARLALVTGVSASHLKTWFKRSTGLPVHEYVVHRRVERAKRLLLRGDLPASEVALAAGFAHQSHMARCMRRVLGVTPGALVRRARAAT